MRHQWTAEKAGFLRWTVRVQDRERGKGQEWGEGMNGLKNKYEAV